MTPALRDPELGTINRTPHTPALDGTHLAWLIEQFLGDRRAKLDNQKTVDGYTCRLRWFTTWWDDYGPAHSWQLQQPDLIAFERFLRTAISSLTKRPLAYNFRISITIKLREVFNWAWRNGYTERSYAVWVVNAHGGPPKRKAAGITALVHLLAEASNSRKPTRDRAMIAMFIGMGLRRSEISNLNIEHLVFEADLSGYAHIYGKRTTANPTGERDAAFDAATGRIIAEHIDAGVFERGPLFYNRDEGRLAPVGVYRVVKAIVRRAGLSEEIQGCHDLRRSFATHYARTNRGQDSADRIRRQLGHANFSQTTDYQLLDVHDIRSGLVSPVSFVVAPSDNEDCDCL